MPFIYRGPSRCFEEELNKTIKFRGTREQNYKTERNREQMQFCGTGEIDNRLWGTRENADFLGEQGNRHPMGGPQYNIIATDRRCILKK